MAAHLCTFSHEYMTSLNTNIHLINRYLLGEGTSSWTSWTQKRMIRMTQATFVQFVGRVLKQCRVYDSTGPRLIQTLKYRLRSTIKFNCQTLPPVHQHHRRPRATPQRLKIFHSPLNREARVVV